MFQKQSWCEAYVSGLMQEWGGVREHKGETKGASPL